MKYIIPLAVTIFVSISANADDGKQIIVTAGIGVAQPSVTNDFSGEYVDKNGFSIALSAHYEKELVGNLAWTVGLSFFNSYYRNSKLESHTGGIYSGVGASIGNNQSLETIYTHLSIGPGLMKVKKYINDDSSASSTELTDVTISGIAFNVTIGFVIDWDARIIFSYTEMTGDGGSLPENSDLTFKVFHVGLSLDLTRW